MTAADAKCRKKSWQKTVRVMITIIISPSMIRPGVTVALTTFLCCIKTVLLKTTYNTYDNFSICVQCESFCCNYRGVKNKIYKKSFWVELPCSTVSVLVASERSSTRIRSNKGQKLLWQKADTNSLCTEIFYQKHDMIQFSNFQF